MVGRYNEKEDRGAYDKSTVGFCAPAKGCLRERGVRRREPWQGPPGKGNNILFTVAFAECYRPFGMLALRAFRWPVRKDGFIFL